MLDVTTSNSIVTAIRHCAPFPDELDLSREDAFRVPLHATINDYLAFPPIAPIGSLDLALTAKLERFLRTMDDPAEAPLVRYTRPGDARGCWTLPPKAVAKGESGVTMQLRKLARFIDGCDDEDGTGEGKLSGI